MSRSIHQTNRDILLEDKYDYSAVNTPDERIRQMFKVRSRKRRIKRKVISERKLPPNLLLNSFSSPENIPFLISDKSKYIHYPANKEDFLGVMRLLPKGVLNGLTSIELCLGSYYQDTPSEETSANLKADPFTGRYGYEVVEGIFGGSCLGIYRPWKAQILVFAYIYELSSLENPVWEFYLKWQMLKTFVHEVAHHYDHSMRIARGRWRADTKDEIYAEKMEQNWNRQCVREYLYENYREQGDLFFKWVKNNSYSS